MGDNIYLGDRNGVRTPMQWSPDRNAGFSRANPQQLYLPVVIDPEYHARRSTSSAAGEPAVAALVDAAADRAAQAPRPAFGRGAIEFLLPENRKVLDVPARRTSDERILVVANLSRFAQYVELDLSRFQGMTPGRAVRRQSSSRAIGELPYLLTLGPHDFYWFSLEPQRGAGGRERRPAAARVRGHWTADRRQPARHARALEERSCRPGCARGAGSARKARRMRSVVDREYDPHPGPGDASARRRSATCCSCAPSTPRATARPTACRCRAARRTTTRRAAALADLARAAALPATASCVLHEPLHEPRFATRPCST